MNLIQGAMPWTSSNNELEVKRPKYLSNVMQAAGKHRTSIRNLARVGFRKAEWKLTIKRFMFETSCTMRLQQLTIIS